MTIDRSRAGRIARNRGKTWEREVANFMKQWFPNAHRRGYDQAGNAVRAAGEQTPDVAGTPYWIECKSRSGEISTKQKDLWMSEQFRVFHDFLLFTKDTSGKRVWFLAWGTNKNGDFSEWTGQDEGMSLDEFAIYMDFEKYLEEGDK